MSLKIIHTTIAALCCAGVLCAQNTYQSQNNFSPRYTEALHFYEQQNYTAALNIFDKEVSDNNATYAEKSNAAFYLAMCAKLVGNDNRAEMYFSDFMEKYPESIYMDEALMALGSIRFNNKDYKEALAAFEKIDAEKIEPSLLDEYHYKTGYCLMKSHRNEQAKSAFYQSLNSQTNYGKAATFNYGVLVFDEQNYDGAIEIFSGLLNDPEFQQSAIQYIMRIYLARRQYDKIVELYPQTDENANHKSKDGKENVKIFADAYYKTGNCGKAVELYESVRNNLSPEECYQLAVCYYEQGSLKNALANFEVAENANDTISQNALYHIGLCNMQLNDKNFAATAFRNAYKKDVNPQITEKALFNYIKIVYDTGFDPYNEAITILQDYINQHGDSENIDEAVSYLAKLFLMTNNYAKALKEIDKLSVKNDELKAAYQKINYSGAIENFKAKKYGDALTLFKMSTKYPQDDIMAADATYWTGECHYNKGNYAKAEESFSHFQKMKNATKSKNYVKAYYSIGYCYFKQKKYKDSERCFANYVKNESKSKGHTISDAYNRIGDCNFIRHNYDNAIESYGRAMSFGNNRDDYSLYYTALAQGAQNKLSLKVETLKKITNMSNNTAPLRINALYEMANTYSLNNENDQAITTYKQLVAEYPKSALTIKSKQKIGMLLYNQGRNEEAIQYLSEVVSKYPGTQEATESIAMLKNIYVENGNVDAYFDFVKSANIATSTSEEDSLTYASALKQYMDGNYDKAKKSFANYLQNHPQGAHYIDVNYYLGECYFNEKNYDKALTYYKNVFADKKSIHTEDAQLKAAKILQMNKKFDEAAAIYTAIVNNSEYDHYINEAEYELMTCYHETKQYELLAESATKVLNTANINEDAKKDAEYYHAVALFHMKKHDEAYKELSAVAKLNSGERSAEAKYLSCNILYLNKNYTEAEKQTFELINNFASYDYWVTKGFILLADIYVKTDNVFQARQTLQSIIDNHEGDDLKKEAQEKLDKIDKKQ